jgi:hypothetical protein
VRSEIALGARKSPQTSWGHRYLIANLIYRFRFTSFFRHRYAFSLQLSELSLASCRIAVITWLQTSQSFLGSSVLLSLRRWLWYACWHKAHQNERLSSERSRDEDHQPFAVSSGPRNHMTSMLKKQR